MDKEPENYIACFAEKYDNGISSDLNLHLGLHYKFCKSRCTCIIYLRKMWQQHGEEWVLRQEKGRSEK